MLQALTQLYTLYICYKYIRILKTKTNTVNKSNAFSEVSRNEFAVHSFCVENYTIRQNNVHSYKKNGNKNG